MTPDVTEPVPSQVSVAQSPFRPVALYIPSFRQIATAAFRLYCRNFWAYFTVTLLAVALLLVSLSYLTPLPGGAGVRVAPDRRSALLMLLSWFAVGIAVPFLTATALVDTSGARATAPQTFLLVVRRLPSFLAMWAMAACIVCLPLLLLVAPSYDSGDPARLPFVAPCAIAASLYVGVAMMAPVFFAERVGPSLCLPRSWRLSWKRTVWLRILQLTAAALVAWAGLSAAAVYCQYAVALPFAPEPLTGQFTVPFILVALAILFLSAALVLPLLVIAKVVLYRCAVLLYPPRQTPGAVATDNGDIPPPG